MNLKVILDRQPRGEYRRFDELRHLMSGAVFFLAMVVVLVPAEVCHVPYLCVA